MEENSALQTILKDFIQKVKNRDTQMCLSSEFLHDKEIEKTFLNSLGMSEEETFDTFFKLALAQSQSGVPYSQYSHFLNKFSTELINTIAQNLSDANIIGHVNKLKSIVTNASAKAYLFELLNTDIPVINAQLEEYVAITYINAHLYWMKRVIYDIENGVDKPTVELNPKRCDFGTWLSTGEISKYFSPSEVESIHHTHHTIHNSGKSLYQHLKNKEYTQVLIDYLFLSRISIDLVSHLNVKITHQFLSKEIETDPLTQLKNRHSLEKKLEIALSKLETENIPFSIAMIDIDFFKNINDTYGHQVGDDVLVTFAKILRSNTRFSDTVFRYGGEEFLILFENCPLHLAVEICEKLRLKIEAYRFSPPLEKITLTASFGVVSAESPQTEIHTLIKLADEKLYHAKRNGRNQVSY